MNNKMYKISSLHPSRAYLTAYLIIFFSYFYLLEIVHVI